MFIKQVIIQGFKSYKDQTVIEPFSQKHNVIVGRNGSGKSNFFAAIRFVLSDAYTQMGREERQALLHEGSGSAVMSAYVEIVFDNSDDRFPTGKEEVILRRTIGLKKDEYSLDRKNATKSDVMNLLESAGFSKSNPYYIVPQGRVTALTNMKDNERLNLLKEVAGTQVYEARRSESIRIMTETESKRNKIDDLLTYIKQRLTELEEEKEELREFQERDKERRCLEYTIHQREQEELANQLEKLENDKLDGADSAEDRQNQFLDGEQEISELEEEIRALKQQLELLEVDKRQYDNDRREMARERAKAELELKNMDETQANAQSLRQQHEKDVHDLDQSVQERETRLAQIVPDYDNAKAEEEVAKQRCDNQEGQRQRLYAKQGRSSKWRNKKERDDWLNQEINDSNVALATRKAVRMQTDEEIANLEQSISELDGNIEETRKRLDNRGEDQKNMADDVQRAREVRNGLLDQRKELWREQDRLDSILTNTQLVLSQAEQFLSTMMDQNTSRGIAKVRQIKDAQKLQGVHGTLAELFEVPDKYKTAVEVTAGNSLFHYVVDNEETATQVLEALQRERGGRVTFMPLNRLRPNPINMPSATDAVPIMSRLKYDPRYEKALLQVFGRSIVCPNLQIAAQYARSHGVNAITPEGDRSDRKGALSGGFVDPRQSRLDGVQRLSRARAEHESHAARKREIRDELDRLDQENTRANGEFQKLEQKRLQFDNSYIPLQQDLRSKKVELQNERDALDKKRRAKNTIEAAVKELTDQQTAFQAELLSDFKKILSNAEEQQLTSLNDSIPSARKEYNDICRSRAEIEVQKTTIELELRENLFPRRDELNQRGLETSDANTATALQQRHLELQSLNTAFASIERKLAQAESELDKAKQQMAELQQKKTNRLAAQEEVARIIEKTKKRMDKGSSKKAMLTERMTEVTRSVRNLGVLPEEAFSKYNNVPSDQAIKRLHKANEVLKKYSNINKKAFEQYNNFTRQRDNLNDRRAELDASQTSIEELIEVLDQRKDEAIERTFKQVSREFANVFERLVPAGRGRLVIQRRSDRAARAEDEDDEDEDAAVAAREGVENYTGVGIAVSFNSKHDEQQRIQQLSGGQKSLCALALVFAIQQCDPAPFYLFDEIDANLDAQYRTAVAQLLEDISRNGQFICTTFRPEMVQVAEKCYGVAYSNKTSSIDVVDREEALKFVDGQISGA